jgi:hypothetical protein
MAFENRFGFSLSRESMFDECRRRYYFHYYLSWKGWEPQAPTIVREAFRLKRLVSLALWRGQLIHYVTTKVLQSMKAKGHVPEKSRVLDYTLERFDKQLAFSSSGRYRTEPKKRSGKLNIDWLAIFEHEYGRRISEERIEQIRQECVEGINGLFAGPMIGAIFDSDSGQWEIEDLDHAEFSQNFIFHGVTVYAKTDLIFRGRDGSFNIVDWKTNRPHASEGAASPGEEAGAQRHRVQLGIYGYHAAKIRNEPLDSIHLYEVNLLDQGRVVEYAIGEDELEIFDEHIVQGISKLSSVLVDFDTRRNEPLPPDSFPTIDNGDCRFCNFYRICKDESSPHRLD